MLIHGFALIQERHIQELNTRARLFRHVQTGAQLLSMENDDENKVFGVAFRTPPSDSTGVPHILEHSVLDGSRKYPVKSPFDQMAKASLKTFINAITYPDKTVYPVASQNLQDFYNLVDVYLDAVFHPLIGPETLQQEGWHYELADEQQPLSYKGVVFNEMKGVFSSPDGRLHRFAQLSLFPDTTYGFVSGGDPRHIPDLTYEQFKNFYERYYHPSNARIWFYGDDDPDERLRLIDEYLQSFDALDIDSSVPLQARFDAPRHIRRTYDAGEESGKQKRTMVVVNWLLPDPLDAARTLTYEIFTHVLIGTPASPLRKALIDSQLGEELAGGGLATSLRQMYFSLGLKGIASEDAANVEALILRTLERLAHDGIDPEVIEAALNTAEFRLRENNTGSFPRGLALMLRALTTWLYDGDPLALIAFEKPLAALKRRVAAGERVFEDLIRDAFLQNKHRTTLVLEPEAGLSAREEAEEKQRLAAVRATLSEAQLREIVANTQRLKQLQSEPDKPEALAALPMLKLSDIDRENKRIPCEVQSQNGTPLLFHDLFTNGIVYLDVGFDLRTLPPQYLPYVPLFGRALLEMGTEREDFTRLALRIGRKTGGIGRATITSWMRETQQPVAWTFLRGKATMAQANELLAILQDILLTVRLDDRERFRQMVQQEKARSEAGLVPAGNFVASQRLKAHLNVADWAAEQMGGVSNLFFVRALADEVERDWAAVRERLETMRQLLINRKQMIWNVTLDAQNWAQLQPRVAALIDTLPARESSAAAWPLHNGRESEGLTIPSKVNYVAKGDDLYRHGFQPGGWVSVATHLLSRNYVRERVRVQGGAYGGACSFDRHTGIFNFSSYRDPNLSQTVANYDDAAHFLRSAPLDEEELTKHIIGVIGQLDTYMLPDTKGYVSLLRYLIGDDDATLQRLREQILSATVAQVRSFADMLDHVKEHGLVVVLGSPEAIDAANEERGGWLRVSKVI